MAAYSNLIRLARPGNLLIVAVTMLVVRLCVIKPLIGSASIGMTYGLDWGEFFLLMLVAIMLTAAGNIINDYFDQKVDRINKPDKVIVGKLVKRRVAIILHQSLNIGAILFSVYLSMATSFWWPLVIPVIIATLLWWYSPVLKKKAVVGNLVIALCTACVPLWAGVFELHELRRSYGDMLGRADDFFSFAWLILISLSFFAFLLTLVREAQKDMEDLQGDTEGGYATLPIRYGIPFTKRYICFLLGGYLLAVLYFLYDLYTAHLTAPYVVLIAALLLVIPTVLSFFQTLRSSSQQDFHRASVYTKIMMLCGLVAFSMFSLLLD